MDLGLHRDVSKGGVLNLQTGRGRGGGEGRMGKARRKGGKQKRKEGQGERVVVSVRHLCALFG